MKADRRLTIARMVELGGVSRAGLYRFEEDGAVGPDPDMDLRATLSSALRWSGPVTAGRGSQQRCGGRAARSIRSGCTG
jgi:hypothetical protein